MKIFKSKETTRRRKFVIEDVKVEKLMQFLKKNTELSEKRLTNIKIKISSD